MKPLSVFMFIKGSIKKILPVVITVSLAVAILYFMSMFTNQLDSQICEVDFYPMKHMSVITGDRSGISVADIENLEKNIGSNKMFPASMWYVDYYSIVGKTGTYVIMLKEKDITTLMNIQKLKLTKGRLPKNKHEILLHERLAANRRIKLETIIDKKNKGWYIDEDLKVVGFFSGESVMGIGYGSEELIRPDMPWGSIIIGGDRTSLNTTNKYIEENLAEKYSSYTLNISKNTMDRFSAPMNTMKLFIGIILVLVIGIFLTNITTIQYTLRRKELELLHAIGYTRRYIIFKGLKEIGIASIIGYVVGIIFAILIGWGINIYFLYEKGLGMPLLITKSLVIMLLVPFAITAFSLIAPLKLTKFRDIV